MPSRWQRFRSWVNSNILGRSEEPSLPPIYEPPPPPPPPSFEPLIEPPPPRPEPPSTGGFNYDYETITNDYGDNLGTHSWAYWWNDTLLDAESFYSIYGQYNTTTVDLIHLLEEAYGIDWDWETWREAYNAANAAA